MVYKYLFCGFILFLSYITYPDYKYRDCLSVPPGGISGFWYTLSKLKQIKNEEYFCASSGCLAVVAKDLDINNVYNIAKNTKDNFNSFDDIKNDFIHKLIINVKTIPNVTIVTMNNLGYCIERKPKNKKELKTLLIKTTDIPIITKNTFREIDGMLCYYYINTCKYNINLPLNYKFLTNLFNFDITNADLNYFYNYV
jgi:hypothetical protein